MGSLPADACPYPRPFPEGFSECAVFDRLALRVPRAAGPTPRSVASCRNLTVGTFWDGGNHHYGRCRLGDGSARMASVKAQIVERHTYINNLVEGEDQAPGLTPIIPR
jgi:hypothetical protein